MTSAVQPAAAATTGRPAAMYSRTLVERASASSGRSRWVATVTVGARQQRGELGRGRRPANVTLRSAQVAREGLELGTLGAVAGDDELVARTAFLEPPGGLDQRAHGMAHADGARVDDPPARGALVVGEHEAPRVDAVGDDDDPLGGMTALAQDAFEAGRGDRDRSAWR